MGRIVGSHEFLDGIDDVLNCRIVLLQTAFQFFQLAPNQMDEGCEIRRVARGQRSSTLIRGTLGFEVANCDLNMLTKSRAIGGTRKGRLRDAYLGVGP